MSEIQSTHKSRGQKIEIRDGFRFLHQPSTMQTSIDKGALSPSGAAAGASAAGSAGTATQQRTVYSVLGAISFSHLLNDMIQSLILAIYPMFKSEFALSFGQIGLITLTYQITASLLQPLVGLYTDKHPKPYSLPVGMGFTLSGLLLMSVAGNFGTLLIAAALVGCGSSVFHPSRRGSRAWPGRQARSRTVAVSGGRQRGLVAGSFARRADRDSARAEEHRVVLGGGARRDVRAG